MRDVDHDIARSPMAERKGPWLALIPAQAVPGSPVLAPRREECGLMDAQAWVVDHSPRRPVGTQPDAPHPLVDRGPSSSLRGDLDLGCQPQPVGMFTLTWRVRCHASGQPQPQSVLNVGVVRPCSPRGMLMIPESDSSPVSARRRCHSFPLLRGPAGDAVQPGKSHQRQRSNHSIGSRLGHGALDDEPVDPGLPVALVVPRCDAEATHR